MLRAKRAVHVIVLAVVVFLVSLVAVCADGPGDEFITHEALGLIEDQFVWLTGAAVACGSVLCTAVLVLWKSLNAERKYRAIEQAHDRQRIDRCLEVIRKRLDK